ncbi:glycosyltransferase family 2 protein [Pseudomonas typographi]|uniref:Glycosyltransferase n=1 Tax=Pseudomonas typographi TaxID=2715964 RepID=A0ABR7YVG3_9PSED|nr:glycosyltransferase [Pseudomonas typographi]MBD1552151.1 glycosyltransferase [Pseudomonas typographi]MBD1585123.1 glycosyltransferase [Pseudomonas typographi]MBD1597170.1 glycosyltransferase [Pseudomonas typographi]
MSSRTEQQIMQGWDPAAEPLLTITCPAYNQREYIAQTLDSFLAQQTDFPFEILVNDDASHDGTAGVIANYAARYPRLIRPVFHQQNQYQQGKYCFPALFNMARGRYIAYCDGDDYWCDPLKLQKQVDFLQAHPDYVITYHDAVVVDAQGEHGLQLGPQLRCNATNMDLLKGRRISTLTAVFRNVLHELPRELEQAPMLDLCWWSLLGAYGKGKYMPDIAPGGYRVHCGGVFSMRSNKRKIHMSLQTHMALANYYQHQGDQKLYEHYLVQVFGLALAAISPGQKLRALALMLRNVTFNLFKRLNFSATRG